MASIDPQAARIIADPAWLAHRYDPMLDKVHFVRADRAAHRKATFLTDEFLPGAAAPKPIDRRQAAAAADRAPIHFIFHSAYCCSTLLARAADIGGVSLGLKEPLILNDLVGWKRRGGEPRAIAEVLDHSLALLSRPFGPGEVVVAKPSNVVNALAPAMLAMRPAAHALLLHAPLETYLASIAKKGMWGRLWVRELFVKLTRDGLTGFGFSDEEIIGQTDLQIAAIGWLAQHRLFAQLVERFGADRVRTLDSETLVARPAEALDRMFTLFERPLPPDAIAGIVSDVFSRHSKLGDSFGREEREAEHRDSAAVHAEEIGKVAAWAEAVAVGAGLSLELKAPLLT